VRGQTIPWAAQPTTGWGEWRRSSATNKQTNECGSNSGLIPSCSSSSLSNRIARSLVLVSLVGLSAGVLRCVVYRDCPTRLLTAGRVATLEQHSHRCSVATPTLFYLSEALVTFELVTSHSSFDCIPEHIRPQQRREHQHQGSFPSDSHLPLNPFENMDKVRVTVLLAVGTQRHRCAASFHPSGKRIHFLRWCVHAVEQSTCRVV
jgi:hypothetical protein